MVVSFLTTRVKSPDEDYCRGEAIKTVNITERKQAHAVNVKSVLIFCRKLVDRFILQYT